MPNDPPPHVQLPAWQRWSLYAAGFALHVTIWLLLVGKVGEWQEWVLAILFSAASIVAAASYGIVDNVRFRPQPWMLLTAWRIPWAIVTGCAQLLAALAKQLSNAAGAESVIAAAPFDVGGDDSQSAARRALAVSLPSMTPNSIMIGIVPDQQRLLYHQIYRTALSPIAVDLGASP